MCCYTLHGLIKGKRCHLTLCLLVCQVANVGDRDGQLAATCHKVNEDALLVLLELDWHKLLAFAVNSKRVTCGCVGGLRSVEILIVCSAHLNIRVDHLNEAITIALFPCIKLGLGNGISHDLVVSRALKDNVLHIVEWDQGRKVALDDSVCIYIAPVLPDFVEGDF